MGYCPFACVESRYNGVYCDTRPGGAAQHVGDAPRYSQTGLRHGQNGPRHSRLRARACGSARARGLAGRVCYDTINCIVTGERPDR